MRFLLIIRTHTHVFREIFSFPVLQTASNFLSVETFIKSKIVLSIRFRAKFFSWIGYMRNPTINPRRLSTRALCSKRNRSVIQNDRYGLDSKHTHILLSLSLSRARSRVTSSITMTQRERRNTDRFDDAKNLLTTIAKRGWKAK